MKTKITDGTGKPDANFPDCGECTHYYITYDVSFPYGCRALGFKGKRKPHLDVLQASGEHCLAFVPKGKAKT
jgi:hypothetical protein